MSSNKILQHFKDLDNMKDVIMEKQKAFVQKKQMEEQIKSSAQQIKKQRVRKDELESQIFCHDGPFLVVVLEELNIFYSISKRMDMAIAIQLDALPGDVVHSLKETIFKKRMNPNVKMKTTITEALLGYLQKNKKTDVFRVYNLQEDRIIDPKITEIIEFHNLKV
jgi:hypothetical protein